MKKITLVAFCYFLTLQFYGQEVWSKLTLDEPSGEIQTSYKKQMPAVYELFSLDSKVLSAKLTTISSKAQRAKNATLVMKFPTPNGMEHFTVEEASVFSPELAAKYPTIKSYVGYGHKDKTAVIRFSHSGIGLHAMVTSGNFSTYFIEPLTKDKTISVAYLKKNKARNNAVKCLVEDTKARFSNTPIPSYQGKSAVVQLRTFRLALACTGEYAQYHLNDQKISSVATEAVKKNAVLSAMNVTMTRVNGVFERDLAVRMVLVGNNDKIIYLNASLDPFNNDNSNQLIDESQTVIDNEIGGTNYDIGHTLSTGGGGLAGLGVVCETGQKARGITGQDVPKGDAFDIDFVAHEMGHQFGANHTQNNNCQRNGATAVEPGSASTIMGYAGICSPNVQSNSDDHFHAASIAEMKLFLITTLCPVLTNTGNNAPTANAGADVTIPRSTPFVLRGQATDADSGNSLTYNWEQIDNEVASMPPVSTNTGGPTFRSLKSKTSPNRYMPDLPVTLTGSTAAWEILPSVSRVMNFALTVRDNAPGGGGTARDDMKVTVDGNAGPFKMTSQGTNVTYNGGSTQTITWDVANTNTGNVNCQTVTIKLSTDGGATFPTIVLANTPNDGSQEVTIPNVSTSQARIMIEADGNLFFAVNTTNFRIDHTASVKDIAFKNFSFYPNPAQSEVTVDFDVTQSNRVSIKLHDIRGRIVTQKSFENVTGRFSEKLGLEKLTSGLYLMQISNGNHQITKKLIVK